MLNKIFGTKSRMQAAYLGDNRAVVTKVKVFNLTVSQVKTEEKDGYNAIQVAFGPDRKRISKPLSGHLKNLNLKPRYIREIRLDDPEEFSVGQTINPLEFIELGSVLNVQGKTKGKGFTGVIKRWGFARQPKTHGQSDRTRAPGSIGQTTGVGRVFKGKKMAGRHGGLTHTVKNSKIVFIDKTNNEIWITGAVPGNQNELISLILTGKKQEIPELKNAPVLSDENSSMEQQPENNEDKKQTGVAEVSETNKTEKTEQQKTKETTEEK